MQIGCFPDGAGSKAWTVHAAQFSETERRAYYKGAQS
jgi:hypothetical protein